MRKAGTNVLLSVSIQLACCACSFALDSSRIATQHVLAAWTVRDGFSLGNLYAPAQTSDGHLLLQPESGLFRFDGLRSTPWQASANQHLLDKNIYGLTTKAEFRVDREMRADLRSRRFPNIHVQAGHAGVRDVRFTHLTTNDGLSQGYVTAILQDRRGFMWFATRDGLNRYDGNAFLVYKNNPNDPGSLSSNFLQDLIEDDNGYLWIATNTGVNKFDPATERCTRYVHDPKNPNGIGSAYVTSIARDDRGYLWFGTA